MYESLEMSSDDGGMIVKPYTQKNNFWAPDGDIRRLWVQSPSGDQKLFFWV